MRPVYRAPESIDPVLRFNLTVTGDTLEQAAAKLGVSTQQLRGYVNDYIPKCTFLIRALMTYPQHTFTDLFYMVAETDNFTALMSKKNIPIPVTYEEAVNYGLKLESSPYNNEPTLRINIYEDDKPVCGFGPGGEFYRYGADFRNSAVAQYIVERRKKMGLDVE